MAVSTVSYAESYSRALAQVYPYVLNFGALYNTENDNRYRWIDSKTIKIPVISTTGRVAGDRDTIGTFKRNFDNKWETKTLENERVWSTLIHPKDIDQSNMVNTVQNITQVFNEEHKFPEMDAYLISKIYTDWGTTTDPATSSARVADTTVPDASNILSIFDSLMLKMDNERVPPNGRILYVTHEMKKLLKEADKIQRTLNVQSTSDAINRTVNRLDEVTVIGVPSQLMKTAYDFSEGWTSGVGAKQINMFLVHPSAVITPVSYDFADLTEPSAATAGKYIYYEEAHEDVFVLNNKAGAIQFNTAAE